MLPIKTRLQKSWIWNNTVEAFVKERIVGYSLNVCAGASKLGDVKIDLDPLDKSILKSDMRCLPFKENTFDTVISDPPWKIGYYERFTPFFECVSVCKVGGKIIYNAYWIPEADNVKLEEVWIRQDGTYTNASIISVFTKIKDDNEKRKAKRIRLEKKKEETSLPPDASSEEAPAH